MLRIPSWVHYFALQQKQTFSSLPKKINDDATKQKLIKVIMEYIDCLHNNSSNQVSDLFFEADNPSRFFKESTRYRASVKLKHRLLTRLNYHIHHVPVYEWKKVSNDMFSREYLTKLLDGKYKQFGRDSEWLDPDDEQEYQKRQDDFKKQFEKEKKKD